MGYKQTVAFSILAGTVAAGGGVVGHSYYVNNVENVKNVTVEATVKVDEKALGKEISTNLIKHNNDNEEYQMKLAQRKGCYANRDNESFLKQHCKGVDLNG